MDFTSTSTAPTVQFNSTVSPALRALLARSIDYAGLFPPAELPLEPALKNHADYLRSDDSWMLSTFVLPTTRFGAAEEQLAIFDRSAPLRISALGAKTDTPNDLGAKLPGIFGAIRELQSRHSGVAFVPQLEIVIPAGFDLSLIGDLYRGSKELGVRVFCESPAAQAERTIAVLAQVDTTRDFPLGFKLRTGGVTADAFPDASLIARALVASVRDSVPIKFTAGLHHPVRQYRDEVKGKMYGFLNVLGAGVMAAEHGWDEATAVQMLEDEDVRSFAFAGDAFSWREWKVSANRIELHRQRVTSFGSCSFVEPREDLRALGLL
ncbi:MAG: hypothetical protein ACJ8M1_01435 [Chthoniobacterales bacterium]